MDFEVSGIKFSEQDLIAVSASDIKSETLAHSHYFMLLGKSRRAILLIRAGDYIQPEDVTDILNKGIKNIFALPVASISHIEEVKRFFRIYQRTKSLDEQLKARKLFLNLIKRRYQDKEEKSFLSFSIAFFEEFYCFPKEALRLYQSVSSVLFSRAIKISTIGVISCFINEYLDYKFLKDFYNTSFIVDYGLVEGGQFNFALALACEEERKIPGNGINKLKQMKRSEKECEIFLRHPYLSYEYGVNNSQNISNPEVLEFLKFHHENHNGTGFPEGIPYSGMNQVETLLSFHDNLIPFEEKDYVQGDLQTLLKSYFIELNTNQHFNCLAISRLKNTWASFLDWIEAKELVA